jgi:eukaryotic-like serine/threonine-protein kinase
MPAPAPSRRSYRFGLFEANVASGELVRQGVRVRLQDQPFRVLTILLERAGEVVAREELREKLWPANTYVEFDGSLNAALKRLRSALGDSADNPIFIETLPKRGYRFIAPVAVEEIAPQEVPIEAPKSAEATAEPDQPGTNSVLADPVDAAARRFSSLFIYAGLAIVLLAGLGLYTFHRLKSVAAQSSKADVAQVPLRKSVAVLGFHNLSGKAGDAWLATALSEMISTELAASKNLRIASTEDVARMKHELPWDDAGSLARDTAKSIRRDLNSDFLVLGSYTVLGESPNGRLRLDVRVQAAETGDILAQFSQSGTESDLFEVAARSGALLRQELGASAILATSSDPAIASLPSNAQALRLYSEGLSKLQAFDVVAARDEIAKSVALEPSYPLGHAALADCWSSLGYEQRAKDEARKAFELSTNLPSTERTFIEARYHQLNKDWDRSIDLYRQLSDSFPDDLEYGLRLVDVLVESGRGKKALVTIQQLKQLPQPLGSDRAIRSGDELGAGSRERCPGAGNETGTGGCTLPGSERIAQPRPARQAHRRCR